MALALVSVLALAALAAALVLFLSRRGLVRRVAAGEAEVGRLGAQAAADAAERDQLRDKVEWLTAANARLTDESDRHRARADELSVLLDAATAEAPGVDADGAGLWHLMLAHITRRWAAVVGVPPDGRTVLDGDPAAQLAQALARETERLREEVGVDVELNAPAVAADDDVDSGRVAVLVAALELLGVLATSAQRVTVDVGEHLVLTGVGWADPYGELASVYDRVVAAGVALGPLEIGDEQVRLVVRHRA